MDTIELLKKRLSKQIVKIDDLEDLEGTLDDVQISNTLNDLIKRKVAYRLGIGRFIGYEYLWNLILDTIKKERNVFNIQIDNLRISENVIVKVLEVMESEGIVEQKSHQYFAVLDKILSKEAILNFCCHRIDKMTVKDIIYHFGFTPFKQVHGAETTTEAFNHCRKIVNELCAEGILVKDPQENSFSWSDI